MKLLKTYKKLHIWLLADLCLLAAYWLCRGNRVWMNALAAHVTAPLRRAIGTVCYRVDFSVAEALCVLLVVLAAGYLIWSVIAVVKRRGRGALRRAYGAVLGAVCVGVTIYAGFCFLLGIDSYALSGHKIHGPKGIGALVMGPRMRVAARMLGGGQEKALRSGTENTPGIAGLLAAIEAYPRDNNMRAVKLHLYERLREIAGENFRVNGPDPASEIAAPHILNCSLVPVRSETMLYALEGDRVYVANGSACSSRKQRLSPVLSAMNVPRRQAESAIRFSICPYTTMEQVDFAADCIARHYEKLKRYERR